MGDQRDYTRGKNDFYSYTYTSLSPRASINGVTGRVLEKKEAFKSKHADLPAYAKTSDIYFAPGPDGKASQAKLYNKDKRMVLDFDWNHSHTNPDGTNFPKGTVHIQEYKVTKVKNKNGKWVDKYTRLSKKARRMTPAEIKKYSPILLFFNPDLKF